MTNLDDDLEKIKDRIAFEVGDFIFSRSQEVIVDEGKIDTSDLLTSGKFLKEEGFHTVLYDAPHASPVNDGRRPGKMDSRFLHDWVRRKLGIRDPKEVEKISWAIAQAIRQRGIQPVHFIEKAIEKADAHRFKIER